MLLVAAIANALQKTKTAPPKDGTVAITVSPFDGVNRIRFKGSLAFLIFEC
jgi:hypothetical protein